MTALMNAAWYGHAVTVAALLGCGADVNAKSSDVSIKRLKFQLMVVCLYRFLHLFLLLNCLAIDCAGL